MLSLASILALIPFAFVMSITPGPNNIMLTASGVNFGIVPTLPHVAGIFTGFVLMLLTVGFGLGALFETFPVIKLVIKLAGIAYLLFLAFKIATAGSLGGGKRGDTPKPFGFLPAVTFQWVNVKAWVMAISAMAIYVRPGHTIADVLVVSAVFGLTNVPCLLIWTSFGAALRAVLKIPSRIRIFNIAMGVMLVLSILPMIWV